MTSSSENLGRGPGDLFEDQPISQPILAQGKQRYTPVFVDRVDAPALPDQAVPELVASIRTQGLLLPILVRAVDDRYSLIAGGDRLRAAMEAGLREVPACVVEADDARVLALKEAEQIQHPAPNLRKLKREWKQGLADDVGCEPTQLIDRLKAAGREDTAQLQLAPAPIQQPTEQDLVQGLAAARGLSPEELQLRLQLTDPTPDESLTAVADRFHLSREDARSRLQAEPARELTEEDMLARLAAARDLSPEELQLKLQRTDPTPDESLTAVADRFHLSREDTRSRLQTQPASDPNPQELSAQVASLYELSSDEVHSRLSVSPSTRRFHLWGMLSSAAATAGILLFLAWATGLFNGTPVDSAQDNGSLPAEDTIPAEPPIVEISEPEPVPESEPEYEKPLEPEPMPEPLPAPSEGPDWSWLDREVFTGVTVAASEPTPQLHFDTGVFKYQSYITPDAQKVLQALATQLLTGPDDVLVVVTGHTDDDPVTPGGAYRDNLDIGMARATAVSDFLIRNTDLPAHRVLATSSGAQNPPYPNATPAGKRKNRTVTLRLVAPQ